MGFIQDLQNNKDTQDLWLKRLQDRPWLIKGLANTVNIGSRLLAPLCSLHTLVRTKNQKKIIQLHKIVRDSTESKLKSYQTMMQSTTDSFGFIEWDCCDSLLFTGLVGSTGHQVAITAARTPDYQWRRRETNNPCYPEGSASTISRDMFTGLLWYIWRNNRLDLANQLWTYGKANSWIMGEGDPARVYLTPGLQATLAEIIYQLGGADYWITRNLPQIWSKGLEGYQAHLQILHFLLRGELTGYVDASMAESMVDIGTRYPDNYLCTLARGRFAKEQWSANFSGTTAALGLEDKNLWPDGRLPSEADRSSHWFFENNDRSKGTDPGELHSGGDLVFCASLLMDYSDTVE